jgi:two-component system sensor histidine kinase YesM
MPKLLGSIDNLSLRAKFILLYLVCVLIPLVALQAFVLQYTTAEIRVREEQNAFMSLDRVSATLENQLLGAATLLNAVVTDEQLLHSLTTQYFTPERYYLEYYVAIRPRISRYLMAYAQQITNIELYVDNVTILSGGYCMRLNDAVRARAWFAPDDGATHMQAYLMSSYSTNVTRPQISLVRTVQSGGHTLLLKIDLNMELIHSSIFQERQYLSLYLVSPEGRVVSSTSSFMDWSPLDWNMAPPEKADLTHGFFFGTPMGGWELKALVNTEPMRESIRNATVLTLAVGIGLSVFAAIIAMAIGSSILRRSKKLLTHMDAVGEGRFEPVKEDIGKDEIGELIQHYNQMSAQLEQLIRDVYTLELQKKSLELERIRAELKYLQAQVDPHFLFNTLNAILVVCVKWNYSEVSGVIRSLSKILRRMVDVTDDCLPLSTELDFTRMYLEIERFRFGDKLSYSFDIQEEAMGVLLPKMCLQSLAENACKHGIQHATGKGEIAISAVVEGDELVLTVRDSGVGMAPTRLYEVRGNLTDPQDPASSIGLRNIFRRLELYYGSAASMDISSEPGLGTSVILRMPVKDEGGEMLVPRIAGG